MRILIRVLAMALIAATCIVPGVGYAVASLQALNLHLADLPPMPFHETLNKLTVTPDQGAKPYEEGQLALSEVMYTRLIGQNVQQIFSFLALYRTAALAEAKYHGILTVPIKPLVPLPFPAVGTQYRATTVRGDSGIEFLVTFWRGRYVIMIGIDGPRGIFSAKDLLHLARIVDQRIQTQG